ncbi:MAG: serine/threonine protein phosphatase [Actinomyces sp.]|uniref:metallophosphoesterase family protein n=1 Tax=Actinomyces sp. TaxID=29317 RepID=UPI0026DA8412|nr:serine/threonine protein phosphatase [Actinomyces sp.]MDO4242624.1 serine/threonine protein phosphatase [Actinomyces sp.]
MNRAWPGAGSIGPAARRAARLLRRAARRGLRAVRRWWYAPTETFRTAVRTLGLLVVTGAFSLALGLSTATATSPVGPHMATWSVTLDSTARLDLGPLGEASVDSPAGILGVDVVLGEIPAEAQSGQGTAPVSARALGEALSADGASYVSLASHPELTISSGVRALVDDGLRRAGLIESVILCLVAAARLAAGGRLRDALRAAFSRDTASTLLAVTAAATAVALVVPALRSDTAHGSRIPALAGTPWQDVRLSGRIADVAQAYGPRVTEFLDDNDAFYSTARSNLEVAWAASQAVDGAADVTAANGRVTDPQGVAAAAAAAASRQLGAPATGPAGPATGSAAPATAPSPTTTSSTPTASSTPTPSSSPTPGPEQIADPGATGPWAVRERGRTTVVLTTDLHCNLEMITLAGALDELAGADIHMDDGDLTMTGSEPEQVCVDALTQAVPAGVERVATIGNHDSASTAARLRAQGWTVTDGSVQRVGDLTVLGDVDPDRSPAGGTFQRGAVNATQLGQNLADTTCRAARAGEAVDVVLIHQPYTFGPLVEQGCAPLLVAGHVHEERGVSVSAGSNGQVAQLVSGAGQGGTSLGPVSQDAYLHVLSFDAEGRVVAWRAIVLHPDASVTVGAWQPLPAVVEPTGGTRPTG